MTSDSGGEGRNFIYELERIIFLDKRKAALYKAAFVILFLN